MMSMTAPRELDEILAHQRALFEAGKPVEDVLSDLRKEGASVIDCIRAVMSLMSFTLNEAKEFVHNSDAWADMRESFEADHAKLERRLKQEMPWT
jgi:ribosomal protein L7/L12